MPAKPKLGVPVICAVLGETPGAFVVNVKTAGFPACVIVSTSPASASVAVAVIVAIGMFSAPLAVAGAVIAGGWSCPPIVKTVVVLAVALNAPDPSFTVHTML